MCDMGTNKGWNADFTAGTAKVLPCCCGPKCAQTQDWVLNARMNNFDTLVEVCKDQMSQCNLWPEGVQEIFYGDSGSIKRKDMGC